MREEQRALPAYEKPPAWPVDVLRRLAQIAKLGHRFDHTFAGISGIYGIYCISGTYLFYIINIFP